MATVSQDGLLQLVKPQVETELIMVGFKLCSSRETSSLSVEKTTLSSPTCVRCVRC